MIYMAGITTFHDIEKQKAFDRIKERTNGLLDIRSVPHGALPIKSEEWLRAVGTGELAMCESSGGYHAGDFPMLGVFDVPYIFTNKMEKRVVYEAVRPIVQRELAKDGIHVLSYRPAFTQCFATTKPVDVMDLEGMKIRSYSLTIARIIEAMGGTPVPVAWAEVPSALEKGVADGLMTGADSIYSAKLHKIVTYSYDIGLIHGIWFLTVNKDLWDALPKDVQNIVHEELSQWEGLCLIYSQMEMVNIYDQMLADGGEGHEVAPAEFFDLMRTEVTTPLMAEEVEKAGAVGQEILTAIEQALGKTLH